jgi:hypothetical protein
MPAPTLADVEEFVNVLYFGPGGSGKSTAAAHMAKLGKVIAIDCESGLKRRPLSRLGIPVDNIIPYQVYNFEAMNSLAERLANQLAQEADAIKAGTLNPADRVIGVQIDSFTELQKRFIEDIVDTRNKRRSATMVVDPFEVDLKEQGKMTEMCRRVSRRLRDLPCHVAFVTLDKAEVDNEAGGKYYRPALTPAFANDLIGYVDIVLCTRQEEGDVEDRSRFVASTQPTGRYRGKDRFGVLPPVFANPTFERVVEYVNSDYAPADPFQDAYDKRMDTRAVAGA